VIYSLLYTVPERYQSEAQGLLDGVVAAGGNLYVPMLQRDLDTDDIGMLGAMPDMDGFVECTSMIGWGAATQGDPTIAGGVAIVRNMDWIAVEGDPTALPRETIIIAANRTRAAPRRRSRFPGCSAA